MGLLSEVVPVDEEQNPAHRRVGEKAVGECAGRECLSRAGRKDDQRAVVAAAKRTFEGGNGFELAIAQTFAAQRGQGAELARNAKHGKHFSGTIESGHLVVVGIWITQIPEENAVPVGKVNERDRCFPWNVPIEGMFGVSFRLCGNFGTERVFRPLGFYDAQGSVVDKQQVVRLRSSLHQAFRHGRGRRGGRVFVARDNTPARGGQLIVDEPAGFLLWKFLRVHQAFKYIRNNWLNKAKNWSRLHTCSIPSL